MIYKLRPATPKDDQRFKSTHESGAKDFSFDWLKANDFATRCTQTLGIAPEDRVIRVLVTEIVYGVMKMMNQREEAQAKAVEAQAAEIERLLEIERENALKLKQILDLEEILYATRIISMNDGSPCWCVFPSFESGPHSDYCAKAREATEPMWKREALQPQESANGNKT